MQIETVKIEANVATHNLYYDFLDLNKELVSENRLIYRTRGELSEALENNGFKLVKIYGDWEGEDFLDTHGEMIFLAQKI